MDMLPKWDFCFLQNVHTGSGTHTASYTVSTTGVALSPREEQFFKSDHSPPSNAEVKNVLSYTSTPLHTFVAWPVTFFQLIIPIIPTDHSRNSAHSCPQVFTAHVKWAT